MNKEGLLKRLVLYNCIEYNRDRHKKYPILIVTPILLLLGIIMEQLSVPEKLRFLIIGLFTIASYIGLRYLAKKTAKQYAVTLKNNYDELSRKSTIVFFTYLGFTIISLILFLLLS